MLYEVTPLTRPPPRIVPLPIMVDPMEGEALISWCRRLGTRLGLSPRGTADMLGVDASNPAWWRRPGLDTLSAISRRTGVGVERLRAMTLLDWAGLEGQATPGQIVGRCGRSLHRPATSQSPLCVACPQCLAEDREPWMRLDWLTGWATICAVHQKVLVERYDNRRYQLRMPTLGTAKTIMLGACPNWAAFLLDACSTTAHPAVLALQQQMLRAMRDGKAQFLELGSCAWSTMTDFIGNILQAVWRSYKNAANRRRQALFARITEELGLPPTDADAWENAYGVVLIATWALQNPAERLPVSSL